MVVSKQKRKVGTQVQNSPAKQPRQGGERPKSSENDDARNAPSGASDVCIPTNENVTVDRELDRELERDRGGGLKQPYKE